MPSRLALIGAKEGAWVSVERLKKPAVRITGLKDGAVVKLFLFSRNGSKSFEFLTDGDHLIERGSWIRMSCDKPNKSLVCTIIEKVA